MDRGTNSLLTGYSSRARKQYGSAARRWAERAVLLLALMTLVRKDLWMPTVIVGRSMLPTLTPGQWVGINKVAYWRRAPARSDIVFFAAGKELLVKRVIGLPGEEVAVTNGRLYVNGVLVREPYLEPSPNLTTVGAGRLGPNQFVVAGDNRSESVIAVLNRERIVGKLCTW